MHASFVEKDRPTYAMHLAKSFRAQNLCDVPLPLQNGSNLASWHVVDRMQQEVWVAFMTTQTRKRNTFFVRASTRNRLSSKMGSFTPFTTALQDNKSLSKSL